MGQHGNIYSVSDKKHYSLTPDMKNNWIVPTHLRAGCSSSTRDTFAASLKDPITGEIISLPPLATDFSESGNLCLLSNKPSAAAVGGPEWRKHRYDIGTRDDGSGEKTIASTIVALRGNFYYSVAGLLGVLQFKPERPVFTWLTPEYWVEYPDHDGKTMAADARSSSPAATCSSSTPSTSTTT
ncbi:hypothetical protein E2562_034721 [Oryza meyeriana var. granulata]|uniref:Uncharacterized protein n=1 Tax=Oryza meyeriana var. granulata TaxID=110450 RepID=A0A6G1CAM4_9ORYZ|nr:hypothetical protein E2562_034721 [Oryza meyeriana var. granulata]